MDLRGVRSGGGVRSVEGRVNSPLTTRRAQREFGSSLGLREFDLPEPLRRQHGGRGGCDGWEGRRGPVLV